MADKKTKTFPLFLKSILILVVIAYSTWTVGQSIRRNYQTNQQISAIKKDIATLTSEIEESKNLNVYYQSDSFKEVEARRRLGAKAQDEQVIILPKKDTQATTSSDPRPTDQAVQDDATLNWEKWWEYLFAQHG